MRYRSLFAGLIILAAGCASSDTATTKPAMATPDHDFFKMITLAYQTQIESSKTALAQSQNPSVKAYAERIIDEDTAAQKKLAALASDMSIALPEHLDFEHQNLIDGLKGKTGADFDRTYAQLQATANKSTLSLDQDEANHGNDPRVEAVAGSMLGMLQRHASMAEELQNRLI